MSTFWKIVVGLVIIAIIVWGIMAYSQKSNSTPTQYGTEQAAAVENSGTTNTTTNQTNADTSVSQDMATVDVQMKVVDSNAQAANQTSDTPVAQTE